MRYRLRTLLIVTILATLPLLGGCPLGTPYDHYRPQGHRDMTIAVSPSDDTILFNATGSGGRDLYILRLTDGSVVRIAETPEYETTPSFSPDGRRFVYAAGVRGDRADHIFIMRLDGTGKAQLTKGDANDTAPRFSPDGSQIVFARDKTYIWGGLAANWDPGGVICLINADGSGLKQLTPDDDFAYSPCFSENGKSVFYSTMTGLFCIPLDGSQPAECISRTGGATISPNEKQIVFGEGQYAPDYELFIANLDGTGKTQLTNSPSGCYHPVFTNRGDPVYFLMDEWSNGASGEPKSSVWSVKTDGTDAKAITDLSLFDAPLSWKPKIE